MHYFEGSKEQDDQVFELNYVDPAHTIEEVGQQYSQMELKRLKTQVVQLEQSQPKDPNTIYEHRHFPVLEDMARTKQTARQATPEEKAQRQREAMIARPVWADPEPPTALLEHMGLTKQPTSEEKPQRPVLVYTDPEEPTDVLGVWGEDADLVFRLRLLRLARAVRKQHPDRAKRARELAYDIPDAKLKHTLERWEEGDDDNDASDDEDEQAVAQINRAVVLENALEAQHGWWIVTPLRNDLQICCLRLSGKSKRHPWAQFVAWFLDTYNDTVSPNQLKMLYSERQLLQRPGYEVQFMSTPPYNVTLTDALLLKKSTHRHPVVETFQLNYTSPSTTIPQEIQHSKQELDRLKKRIKELEREPSRRTKPPREAQAMTARPVLVYTDPEEPKDVLGVWGEDADLVFRLRLLRVARAVRIQQPERAQRACELAYDIPDAKLKHALERWDKGDAEEDAHMDNQAVAQINRAVVLENALEAQHGWWIVTPLRNDLQICCLRLSGKSKRHPWAQFVAWFLDTYNDTVSPNQLKMLYSERQLLQRPGYEVQFMSMPPYNVTLTLKTDTPPLKKRAQRHSVVETFQLNCTSPSNILHPERQHSKQELDRLKEQIKELEREPSRRTKPRPFAFFMMD